MFRIHFCHISWLQSSRSRALSKDVSVASIVIVIWICIVIAIPIIMLFLLWPSLRIVRWMQPVICLYTCRWFWHHHWWKNSGVNIIRVVQRTQLIFTLSRRLLLLFFQAFQGFFKPVSDGVWISCLDECNCFLESVIFPSLNPAILLNWRELILLIFEDFVVFVIMQIIRITFFLISISVEVVGVVNV